MDNAIIQAIMTCSFFKGCTLTIESIYKSDPIQKCFLVRDLSRKKNFKVRLFIPEYPQNANSEYQALKFLHTCDIEWIPTIYYASMDNTKSILISEFYGGISIDKIGETLTLEEFSLIKKQLLKFVNDLHTISGDYFGDFSGNIYRSWEEFFNIKFYNHVNNALKIKLINAPAVDSILKVYQSCENYFKNIQSCFLHFDIKPANIIFNRDTGIVHLIDFELSRFGDKNMEYTRFTTQYNPEVPFYKHLFHPLMCECIDRPYEEFIKSNVFLLYELYSLLAYYTTSYITHGIKRDYIVKVINKNIQLMKQY